MADGDIDVTPRVEVTLRSLETWRAAVNTALFHNTAIDLVEQYRKFSSRPQSSPMTKALQATLEEIEMHLELLVEPEVETDE